MKTFTLDGITGCVDANGFVKWHTVCCWVDSLGDCPLRDAVLKAAPRFEVLYDIATPSGYSVYQVYDTRLDVYVNRLNQIDTTGYLTKSEAVAVAEHLNSL